MTPSPRRLAAALAAAALLATLALTAGRAARPRLARAVRAAIGEEARARGLKVEVEAIEIGLWPPVRVRGLHVEKPGGWSVAADLLDVRPAPLGRGFFGRLRLALGAVRVDGPAGLTLELVPTTWDVERGPQGRAILRAPFAGLEVARRKAADGIEITASNAPLGRLVAIRRHQVPLIDAGTVDGIVRLDRGAETVTIDLDVRSRDLRFSALSVDPATVDPSAFGVATDVAARLVGTWQERVGRLEVPHGQLELEGARLSASLEVDDARADPTVDLSLEAERVDFARLLRTSGVLDLAALARTGTGGEGDPGLGSASLSVRIRGRLADPASFAVIQRLDFTPPARVPPAIESLRDAFVHEVALPDGGSKAIDVSPASADFVSIDDVPPLFLRTLLLGEDAGFYAHHGVDFSALPSALLADWERGGAIRGASTITQQLAKNLFLSREKRMGRKLQELSLALLLESTLSKTRILEIYLNVIEWGPGLYGLRPAARRYFDREPAALTSRQMAFLVALIPGPIKYQRSFASGALSPGFRPLVDALLAKLRAVDALSEEEYRKALEEELSVVTPETSTRGESEHD